MSGLAKHGSSAVVMINTLFLIIALLFLVSGCFVKIGSHELDTLAQKALYHVGEKIPEEAGIDLEHFSISEFVGGAANVFIAIGASLLVVAIWAYCGTCCESRWMLIVYTVVLTVIILGQVAVIIIFAASRKMIEEAIKEPLRESIHYYQSERSLDGVSMGWSALMGMLHCCGVDGAQDFDGWTGYYNFSSGGVSVECNMSVPLLCYNHTLSSCPAPTNVTDNEGFNQGCYTAVWDLIEGNRYIAIGVAVGVGVFQIILWFLVVCIIRALGKKQRKVSPEFS